MAFSGTKYGRLYSHFPNDPQQRGDAGLQVDESGEKARGGPRGGAPPPSARAHLTLAAVRMRRPPAPPHPRLHSALFRPSALPARTPPVPQVRMTGGRVGEIPGHSWKLLSGWAGKKARTLRTNTSFSRRPQPSKWTMTSARSILSSQLALLPLHTAVYVVVCSP